MEGFGISDWNASINFIIYLSKSSSKYYDPKRSFTRKRSKLELSWAKLAIILLLGEQLVIDLNLNDNTFKLQVSKDF